MPDRFSTVVPRPRTADRAPGTFEFDGDTALDATDPVAAEVLRVLLSNPLRLPLRPGTASRNVLRVRLASRGFAAEAYQLTVREEAVEIVAGDLSGVRHAAYVLLQLLPDDVWRAAPTPGTRWTVQCGEILDAPVLPWRGGMLDVARHFLPKRTILRYVDLFAMHRLNRLHLHLTDDQGWRIESRSYPELTAVGGHRPQSRIGLPGFPGWPEPVEDGTPHGGFYTLADLAEICTYAAERGITVVPEIGLPGHTSAMLAARPDLGIGEHRVQQGAGIVAGVVKPLPATVRLLSSVLEELLEAIPAPYVHLGGDESVLDAWESDPEVWAYLHEVGLQKPADLHGHFLRRMATFLAEQGKRMAVWDEAYVTGGLLDDSIVFAWRGDHVARRAAADGHDVVRCPAYPTYLDYRQSTDPSERLALHGPITLADVAAFTPRPAEWSDRENARIIGAQFQTWSEFIPNERHLDYMVFPRACALAEVAWTGEPTDLQDLTRRLEPHSARFDAAGTEYRPLTGPRPWQTGGTGPWRSQPALPLDAVRRYLEAAATKGVAPTHEDHQTLLNHLRDGTATDPGDRAT